MLFSAIKHFSMSGLSEKNQEWPFNAHYLLTKKLYLSTDNSEFIFSLLLPFGPGCLKEQSNSFALFLFWRNDVGEWPGENWLFCLCILAWFSFLELTDNTPFWFTGKYGYSELGVGQPNVWFKRGRKNKTTFISFILAESNQKQNRNAENLELEVSSLR